MRTVPSFRTAFNATSFVEGWALYAESLGTELGGAAICPRSMHAKLLLYRKDFGGILSSKSAWPILVYGLPSLGIRLQQESRSALEIARRMTASFSMQAAMDYYIELAKRTGQCASGTSTRNGLPEHPAVLGLKRLRNVIGIIRAEHCRVQPRKVAL